MIGDDANYAFSHGIHFHLRKPNELHIVVVQPFRISLAKRLPLLAPLGIGYMDEFIFVDRSRNPNTLVFGMSGIRRVSGNDEDWLLLNGLSLLDLARECRNWPQFSLI